MYETASIKIKKGAIANGAPEGKNKLFSCHLCLLPPIILTPRKCVRDKNKVTTKELVTVKEKGSNPTRFATSKVLNK